MSQQIDYFDNDIRLEGILFPAEDPANSPIVLVVPTYAGRAVSYTHLTLPTKA